MGIHRTLEFILEIDKLKDVERKTLNYHGGRLERSGEHSWHLATAVSAFLPYAKQRNEIDLLKATKMALLHDIVEIDAGDTIIYNVTTEVNEAELAAADRIFGLLPENSRSEFLELWHEFEALRSPEAIYVKSLDRFLPLYSNIRSEGHSWREHNITYEQVLKINKERIQAGVPELWDIVSEKLAELVAKGKLKRETEDA